MRMLRILQLGLGMFSVGCIMSVYAVDFTVAPGTGTLAAAIVNASNGDTLILQEGGYYGDVSVDKSLLIRAQGRSTNAVVAGIFEIRGMGIEVTVQGIIFSQTSLIRQAASVRLLQNHWVSGSIDLSDYLTAEGDGELLVIGNKLDSGNIFQVYSENAYVAGNVLLQGGISTYVSTWIVGNDIFVRGNIGIYADGTGTSARIIGNRVNCSSGDCIRTLGAATSIIQNNIVEIQFSSSQVSSGINALGTNTSIINNIIQGSGSEENHHVGIYCGNSGSISGNILIGFGNGLLSRSWTSPNSCSQSSTPINNNICFDNNNRDCPVGNGNLFVDPQFVDRVGYRLLPTSPAIDAGPSDFELADLDRSRNDIGAYGGPWSIGQYDVQRDPSNYAPYVYPLFSGGAAFSGGTLDIQALGVAKLR